MSSSAEKVSRALPEIADVIEKLTTLAAGHRVGFTLIVFTPERANYVSNSAREDVVKGIQELLDAWAAGMPDVPAHHIN